MNYYTGFLFLLATFALITGSALIFWTLCLITNKLSQYSGRTIILFLLTITAVGSFLLGAFLGVNK
jgi:hypothetical protein